MITLAALGALVYAGVAGFIVIACALEGFADRRQALEVIAVAVTWPVLAAAAVPAAIFEHLAERFPGGRR